MECVTHFGYAQRTSNPVHAPTVQTGNLEINDIGIVSKAKCDNIRVQRYLSTTQFHVIGRKCFVGFKILS